MKIYGKNAIREALFSGKTFNKIWVSKEVKDKISQEIIDEAKRKKIKISFETRDSLNTISGTQKNQGFVAEIIEFNYSTRQEILAKAEAKGELPFVVILDEIVDPHNLGAIIRTCESVGVHGIILQKDRACQINETVFKTSAGAISNMLIARVANLNNEIIALKKEGLWVYGLELGGSEIYKTNLTGPIAVVIGSEGDGIKRLVKENCDDIITLPMKGQINSLNASVATGICLYEILRQRMKF